MRRIAIGTLGLVAWGCGRDQPAPTPSSAAAAAPSSTTAGQPSAAPTVAAPADAGAGAAIDATVRTPLTLYTERSDPRVGPGSENATDIWTFVDGNGDNRVELSLSTRTAGGSDFGPLITRRLRLDHTATRDGVMRTLRTVRDAVAPCPFQVTLSATEVELADRDHDGLGELTFAYQLGCRSDAGPNELKAFLLENGVKYIARGHTRVHVRGDVAGGDIVEHEPATLPSVFDAALAELWEKAVEDDDLSEASDGAAHAGDDPVPDSTADPAPDDSGGR